MFLIGAGMAYVFLPMRAAAFATISSATTGRATALFSAQQQLGGALGVAVLSSVLAFVGTTSQNTAGVQPNLNAYYAAFIVAAVLALLGACIALTIPDKEAAITMLAKKEASKPEVSLSEV
jgi:MFS family permease